MKMKSFIIFAILSTLLGCATGKPMVWIEKDFSLKNYKAFEVTPVANETGKVYDFDVADTITQHLKSKLKEKGFIVVETTSTEENIIIIKSNLTEYEPGSAFKRWLAPGAGATVCTVKSSLIDKKTGKVIGEIVEAKTISEGGLYSIGADKGILKIVATDIADTINNKVKGVE